MATGRLSRYPALGRLRPSRPRLLGFRSCSVPVAPLRLVGSGETAWPQSAKSCVFEKATDNSPVDRPTSGSADLARLSVRISVFLSKSSRSPCVSARVWKNVNTREPTLPRRMCCTWSFRTRSGLPTSTRRMRILSTASRKWARHSCGRRPSIAEVGVPEFPGCLESQACIPPAAYRNSDTRRRSAMDRGNECRFARGFASPVSRKMNFVLLLVLGVYELSPPVLNHTANAVDFR